MRKAEYSGEERASPCYVGRSSPPSPAARVCAPQPVCWRALALDHPVPVSAASPVRLHSPLRAWLPLPHHPGSPPGPPVLCGLRVGCFMRAVGGGQCGSWVGGKYPCGDKVIVSWGVSLERDIPHRGSSLAETEWGRGQRKFQI